MHRISFVIGCAVAIATAPLATAQSSESDKLALARQIVATTTGSPEELEHQLAKTESPTMLRFDEPICKMSRLVVPEAECIEKFRALDRERDATIKALAISNRPAMLEDQAAAMAASFSNEELLALRTFVTSDIGRSIARKQSEISVNLLRKQQERVAAEVGEFSKADSKKRSELRSAVLGIGRATPSAPTRSPEPH